MLDDVAGRHLYYPDTSRRRVDNLQHEDNHFSSYY